MRVEEFAALGGDLPDGGGGVCLCGGDAVRVGAHAGGQQCARAQGEARVGQQRGQTGLQPVREQDVAVGVAVQRGVEPARGNS